jgi:hypothetical protein
MSISFLGAIPARIYPPPKKAHTWRFNVCP